MRLKSEPPYTNPIAVQRTVKLLSAPTLAREAASLTKQLEPLLALVGDWTQRSTKSEGIVWKQDAWRLGR